MKKLKHYLEELSKEQLVKLSYSLLQDNGYSPDGDPTPKQRCEILHVGECGACDDAGNFTACA